MKTAKEYFEEGNKFYDEQDYNNAIDCFQKATKLKPDYAEAYKRLGNVFFDIQDYDKVIEFNEKAIALKPDYEAAYFNTGLAYLNKQNYDKSIEYFRKVIELSPDNADAYFNVGCAYVCKQDDDKAIEFLQKAIVRNYSRPAILYCMLGCLYSEKQKFEEAVENFDKAVAINIDDKEAWYLRGIALMRDEKLDDAIKSFDHALIIDPNDKESWNHKAIVLGSSIKYEEAIECFDKALAIDPNDANMWSCRGNMLCCLGKYEDAIEDNDRALALKKDDTEIWNNRWNILCSLNRHNDAFECFDNSIKINPNFDMSWYFKGCAYGDIDKWEDAIECFDKALEINHDMYKAFQGKMHALQKLGRQDEWMSKIAVAAVMGLAHDPEERRKFREAITGGTKEDLKHYEKLLQLDPTDAALWIDKGRVLNNIGQYKEAVESIERANELASKIGFKHPPVIYDKLTVALQEAKQFIIQHDIERGLTEISNFEGGGIIGRKRQIEAIDIVHFFAENIKQELKYNVNEIPFINFTIEFIKAKDEYFRRIINEEDRNKNKYASMYMLSLLIVDLLYVKEENVAHYTNPIVAKNLLFADEKTKKVSLFRLNDAQKSNDEMESITLLQYLFNGYEEYDIDTNNITFIGCFTFDNNNLNQFRLYGKIEKQEATGISIEVNSDYFEGDNTKLIALPNNEELEHIREKKTYDIEKLSLYRCIYLDPWSGVVEDVGHIAESAAKRGEKEYDRTILENVKAEIKEFLEKLKTEVIGLDKSKTITLLKNLNALVKYYGFKEEQECRVVKILPTCDSNIKTYDDKQYIEYLPMSEYLQCITLPPKSEDEQYYKDLLRKSHLNAKVKVSKHPFRNKK